MTNAEARFNKSLRPRKPEGSLGRTAQDVHLDSHTAPELYEHERFKITIDYTKHNMQIFGVIPFINLQNDFKMTLNN